MRFPCIAYFDESGTSGPIMAVSMCVGSAGKWTRFDKRWRDMLAAEMPAIPEAHRYFHMRDLEHRERNFHNWEDSKTSRVLSWAAKEVNGAVFFAYTGAFYVEDYDEVAKRYRGAPGKYAFAIAAVLQSAIPELKRRRHDISLAYRFEHGARGWKQTQDYLNDMYER